MSCQLHLEGDSAEEESGSTGSLEERGEAQEGRGERGRGEAQEGKGERGRGEGEGRGGREERGEGRG